MIVIRKWWAAVLAIGMYAALAGLSTLNTALTQMTDEQFLEMYNNWCRSRQFYVLVSGTAIATFAAVRAAMNGDYAKAKSGTPQ